MSADEWVEVKRCGGCERELPLREFYVRRRWGEKGRLDARCRACRARVRAKIWMREKRALVTSRRVLDRVCARREQVVDAARVKAENKFLMSRFRKATAVTRRRIAEMERVENPSKRTARALEKRREVLRRYEQALEVQLANAKLGLTNEPIEQMVLG